MAFDSEDRPILGGMILFSSLVLLVSAAVGVGIAFGAQYGLLVVAVAMLFVLIGAVRAVRSIPNDE